MTSLALSAPVFVPARFTAAPAIKVVQPAPAAQIQQHAPQALAVRQDASDEELISAICLGSERAMEMLYQR